MTHATPNLLRGIPHSRSLQRLLCAVSVALLTSVLPGGARAQQSADDILATARDRYEKRAQNVENYSIVQEIGGQRQVAYYERRDQDGHVAFVPVGPLTTLMESGALNEMLGLGSSPPAAPACPISRSRSRGWATACSPTSSVHC